MYTNWQQEFINAAIAWKNIFLSWVAWSGKSYITKEFIEMLKKGWKEVAILAPTGVAATNIWWVTIHSATKLYWDQYDFVKKQTTPWHDFDVVIIDEISMVSAHMFDFIDRVLRRSVNLYESFWWLQIICVWDLSQLPPIINNKDKQRYEEVMKFIQEHGSFDFTKSKAFQLWKFETIFLEEVQRTKDDKFIDLLNDVREWNLNLNDFNTGEYSTHFSNRAVHIFSYNKDVEAFNLNRLKRLPWQTYTFNAKITWKFSPNDVLADVELKLKVWARIMIVKNNFQEWYVNGDMWEITNIFDEWIEVYLDRLDKCFMIPRTTWENKVFDQDWNEEVVWTFTQYPIRLWYSLTIYKCQWLTLNKVVVHYNRRMEPSALYVALSRATDYENLYIDLWDR